MGRSFITTEDQIGALNSFDQNEQEAKDKIHQKLNERCEFDDATGCWVFIGHWDTRGQGWMRVGRRVYPLPRVSAWIYIPGFHLEGERCAYRTCACCACFNPAHLLIAETHAECLRQLRLRGRFGGGRRKLTQAIADQLRFAYQIVPPGPSRDSFVLAKANALGVRPQAVRNIVLEISWVKRAQRRKLA